MNHNTQDAIKKREDVSGTFLNKQKRKKKLKM